MKAAALCGFINCAAAYQASQRQFETLSDEADRLAAEIAALKRRRDSIRKKARTAQRWAVNYAQERDAWEKALVDGAPAIRGADVLADLDKQFAGVRAVRAAAENVFGKDGS